MKKTFLALAAVSLALPAMPAAADPPPWAHAHGYRHHQRTQGYEQRDHRGHSQSCTSRTYQHLRSLLAAADCLFWPVPVDDMP